MAAVIALGIDPGSRCCGWGAVERTGSRLVALEAGVVSPGDLPLPARLARLLEELGRVIARLRPDVVSVESAYCGASARSALVLGQARGVALAAAARAGVPVYEYAPAEVKRAFTGSGQAGKQQMIRTARALLGVEAERADEADALAVAVCHLARRAPPPPARRPGPRPALRPAVRRFGEGR